MTRHRPDAVERIHRKLHAQLPSEPELRVKALESLLVEKRMVDPAAVDRWIELYRDEIGPKRGAQVVARAWTDPAFKARLLADASEAIKEFGLEGWVSGHLKAVENTEYVHNIVVCTLCSCYPHAILGIPTNWYKSASYRSRVVRDPRSVLVEFSVGLGEEIGVQVWDSTAELRYLVVPQRPPRTETWDAARLARLVTRNSMIGAERDLWPYVAKVG